MRQRNVYVENVPLAEAGERWRQALAEAGVGPLPPEEVAVDDALDRITAEPVFAARSVPHYHAAAMDGIAVRFADTSGASERNPVRLAPECFAWVNTGNLLPAGFDAVVMVEEVQTLAGGGVELVAPAVPWQHVRTIGEDIVATELVLPAASRVRPVDLGALLAAGILRIPVRPRPRVAVIPTGSDLVEPTAVPRPGEIVEFNSRVLAGYLRQWGAAPQRLPAVADDPGALTAVLRRAVADHDIVVINAGASAGSRDFTAGVLADLGRVVVHGIAIKPGKPVILALVDGTPVVGLPGYPVSAILTLRLFVRPLVETMLGCRLKPPRTAGAVLSRPVTSRLGVEEFLRVTMGRVGDRLVATPVRRGAGAVMSLVRADGILTVPAASEGLAGGDEVTVELLRRPEEIDDTLVCVGSHDNLLDLLADGLHCRQPPVRLAAAHVGSMGGLMAVRRGEAHLAGTHLLDEATGTYNVPFIQRFLAGRPLVLVNLAYRSQGLMVAPGNPLAISGIEDLARPGVRFINRQRGAGTRLLTDMALARAGIEPAAVLGYDREEYTHMNVGAAVASGSADAGMGILAAAVALGLDFVPVAEERYDLLIPKPFLDDPKIQALLALLEDESFRRAAADRGGYDLRDCGRLMYEQ